MPIYVVLSKLNRMGEVAFPNDGEDSSDSDLGSTYVVDSEHLASHYHMRTMGVDGTTFLQKLGDRLLCIKDKYVLTKSV